MNTIGFTKRLLIIVYDALLLVGILFVSSIVFLFIPDSLEFTLLGKILKALYFLGVSYIFYSWFWRHGGQTLGMKTWGVYLVDANGKFIGHKASIIRFIGALASWGCAGLGFTWILLNKNKLGWHDMISQSYIVKPAQGTKSTR